MPSHASPAVSVRETTLTWSFPPHVGPWTLRGTSRSAHATSYAIPELAWGVDAGAVVYQRRPDWMFLTHTHSDHTSMLTQHKSRRKPPTFVLPAHAAPLVDAYLDAAQILTASQPKPPGFEWTPAYTLHGVVPGDRVSIRRGGQRYVVDVIGCDHSVPCVGYLFSRRHPKLKPVYQGCSGAELGALRQDGVEITEDVETPLFAFLGDTTPKVYQQHPELLDYPVIVGECTFLDPVHRDDAWARKHTHWDDLRPIIVDHPQTTFVVTHFSLRYRSAQIRSFFDADPLPNVVPWIAAEDVR
ncbi:MAG: hypothetical protein AAFV53_02030 [Myxococcota bacterium]